MNGKVALTVAVIANTIALTACKPPPTDADMARDMPEATLTFASDPLPSPETEGAMWAPTSRERLIYGIPGQPLLIAIECKEMGSTAPSIQITRFAPADEGASALLALVGNGHIGRIAVEATEVKGRSVWEGEALASDLAWETLAGPRQVTLTVPGAGMVTLNPSEAPWELLSTCRGIPPEIEPPEAVELQVPKVASSPIP